MQWSDEVTLIFEKPSGTDTEGFGKSPDGEAVTVYANEKSVGFSEFFVAKQAGYTEQKKFDMFTAEYSGQTIAEHNGKRYRVLRTYINPKTSGEFIELTLSDLKERGIGDGDIQRGGA